MLKAGVSLLDISPEKGVQLTGYPHCPRPNEGIHDPLYAACLYLNNGIKEVVFLTLDLLKFDKNCVKKLREAVGFDLMVTTSHTHSGPLVGEIYSFEYEEGIRRDDAYIEALMANLQKKILEAKAHAFDAVIGTAVGKCGAEQGVGGNRRHKGGLCDPSVNVIGVKDMEGKVRACLLNYALHPTYLHAENVLVSADYPGYVRRFLHFSKPDAVFLFAQGTSGDQSSRYHRVAQNFEEAARVGTTLGVAVNNCLESMDYTDTLDIEVKSIEIDLPRKAYPPEDEAKSAMIAAQKRFDSLRNADYITMRNAELDMFGAENIYYYSREIARGYQCTELPCEIQSITLGDTIIVGVQGEIFVEYGLAIKAASKHKKTFVFELTNGGLPGYIYSPEALEEGGYEVGSSMMTENAGAVIVEGAKKVL